MKKISLLLVFLFALPVVAAPDILDARAVIKTLDKATLSGELVAKIIRIPKRMGERFRQGDPLLVLDCSVFQAQKEKVQAELDLAKTKVANARLLKKLNSIGAVDVALAEAEARKSAAELHIAELNTQRCTIKAPYDGIVANVMVNENEIVGQQPLMEVVGLKRLEADIIVPADSIRWLKTGAPVALTIDETGQAVNAEVSFISPSIDPVSQTLQLRAILKDVNGIIPGMSASAHLTKPAQ